MTEEHKRKSEKTKIKVFIPNDLRKLFLESKNQEKSVYELLQENGFIKPYTEFFR